MAAPEAPTALVATHGDGTASIAFTQAAATPAVTNYKFTINDTDYTALDPADAATPITIPALTNGVEYTIKIKAVNDDGDSPASEAVTVTPLDIPAAPTALTAVHGNGTATISFTQAAVTPAVTNYEYTINNADYTALDPADAASPITISGLDNGTEYSIKLKAVNAGGTGPASAAVTVTPSTTPSAPTSLVATAGDNSASIAFTAGATGGSAITDYEYSVNTGVWTSLGDATSPVTVPRLTNDVVSSIRLRAVNANGKSTAATVTVTATDADATNNDGWTDANSFANPGMSVPNLDFNDPDD